MEKKYYLLTFNQQHIPAQSCMNEEEYHNWLESESGELNMDYGIQLKEYEDWKIQKDKYNQGRVERGLDKKRTSQLTGEDVEWIDNNRVSPYKNKPLKVQSYLESYYNESLGYDYSDYYQMKEFVNNDIVKVDEVTEEFYEIFNKTNLQKLSLCNIFNINE